MSNPVAALTMLIGEVEVPVLEYQSQRNPYLHSRLRRR